jgi:hypothetical protein
MKSKDPILLSALRIPYEMAIESEFGSRVFYQQAQWAADLLIAKNARIAELESALEQTTLPSVEPVQQKLDEQAALAHPLIHSGGEVEAELSLAILSDQQILDIANHHKLLIRNSQIALRFARAVLSAASVERLSDEKIVDIARATKTPIRTGKGALRFSRILLATVNQEKAA